MYLSKRIQILDYFFFYSVQIGVILCKLIYKKKNHKPKETSWNGLYGSELRCFSCFMSKTSWQSRGKFLCPEKGFESVAGVRSKLPWDIVYLHSDHTGLSRLSLSFPERVTD